METVGRISVSIEDILTADSEHTLDKLLQEAGEQCGYFNSLEVSWSYWHYGKHAEQARDKSMREFATLLSVAWQVGYRVICEENPTVAAKQREEIRITYQV